MGEVMSWLCDLDFLFERIGTLCVAILMLVWELMKVTSLASLQFTYFFNIE